MPARPVPKVQTTSTQPVLRVARAITQASTMSAAMAGATAAISIRHRIPHIPSAPPHPGYARPPRPIHRSGDPSGHALRNHAMQPAMSL